MRSQRQDASKKVCYRASSLLGREHAPVEGRCWKRGLKCTVSKDHQALKTAIRYEVKARLMGAYEMLAVLWAPAVGK